MKTGRYTFGTERITIMYPDANLVIGSFCSIGQNILIYLGGNHDTRRVTTYPFGHINQEAFPYHGMGHPQTHGDVVIMNDVWIGDDVTIMSGSQISDGAVIANGSHVVGYIGPYLVVGGNPAKTIRPRFDTKTIERLLELQWWSKSDDWINEHLPLLCSSDINKFLDEVGPDGHGFIR